jgi:hypothetical protein
MKRVVAVSLLMIASACAGAPVQEMSDARQAVRAAQAAGAEERAPAELAEARRLIDHAQQQLQRHEYRQAGDTAVEARKMALDALEISRKAAAAER